MLLYVNLASSSATRLICITDGLVFLFFKRCPIKNNGGVILADSSITRRALAEALKRLVGEKAFSKISIGEICDLCNMNRKSFYYHFRDKYELVVWIFENEFLERAKLAEYGNLWLAVSDLCEYFYKNKSFYKKILLIDGQNSFTEYFSDFCKSAFVSRMRERLEGITVTDMNVKIYSNFFVYSIYCWLTGSDSRSDKEFVRDLKNSVLFGAELAKIFSARPDKQITEEDIDRRINPFL